MNHFKCKEKILKKCSIVCMLKTKLINLHNSTKHKDEIIYFILPSKVVVEETLYNTYGIGAYSDGMVVDYIPDLSPLFDKVKSLVNLCNEEKLSLIHLRDVVEDFINAQ